MPESPDALAQYLQRQVAAGHTYLTVSLRPTLVETTFSFTIYPTHENGETAEFTVAAQAPSLIRRQN